MGKPEGPWFRMYASILDNPKLARMSEAQCWNWTKLLALAVVYGGIIPEDLTDPAYRLRKTVGKVRELLQVFISVGLLERCEEGYIPHDWEGMQFSSDVSTSRVKRFREKQRNVSETPPENIEQKQKQKEVVVDARPLLSRICEIFRVDLQADPSRITWLRQVEEMLRDGIPEADIIAGAEVARTNAVLKLSYVRAAAMRVKPTKEMQDNGRPRRESPHRQTARIAAELIAEFEASNTNRDPNPHDSSGVVVLLEGPGGRTTESDAQADVRGFGRKV